VIVGLQKDLDTDKSKVILTITDRITVTEDVDCELPTYSG